MNGDENTTQRLDDDLPDGPPPIEGGRITGRVTDFEGNALVGVRVEPVAAGGGELDLLPTMTDGEGGFLLEGLGEGNYDLRFVLGRVRAQTLRVPSGKSDLQVRLARPQGILLVVKTPPEEPPPALLHVVLVRETSQGPKREWVGRLLSTRLLLWSIRPGRYTVTTWGGPYEPVQAHGVEVREGVPAPRVEVLLGAHGGEVRGRITDAAGGPAAGTLVGWRRLDADGPWPRDLCGIAADDEGRYVVRGLPAGRYLISAGHIGKPIVDLELDVVCGSSVAADLRLA